MGNRWIIASSCVVLNYYSSISTEFAALLVVMPIIPSPIAIAVVRGTMGAVSVTVPDVRFLSLVKY